MISKAQSNNLHSHGTHSFSHKRDISNCSQDSIRNISILSENHCSLGYDIPEMPRRSTRRRGRHAALLPASPVPFPNTEVSVLGRVTLPNTEVSVTRRHSPLVLLRVGRLEQASNTSKRLRRVSYFRYFNSRRHSVELLITTVKIPVSSPRSPATRQAGLPNRTSC
jgi:hypothetical protein